jgi:DNA-binding NarL/FixJ family response regulator
MIRILIADDHEIVRKGLGLVLRLESDFEVVGEARNGLEAVRLVNELAPAVVLLDLSMPDMDGHAALLAIKRARPQARVMMLSGMTINTTVLDTIEDGADGYAIKDISPEELRHAIRLVASGRRYIHAAVTQALLANVSVRSPTVSPKFSARELDVLRLLPTPTTYREMGQRLFISEETVRTHVKNILSKLNQPNRTQAVVTAVKLGLITLE